MDMQQGLGVDYVRDITQKDAVQDLQTFDIVLLCNILEHIDLSKMDTAMQNVSSILNTGGLCIVTVPFNIEHHPSPIDNDLRPSPEELIDLMHKYFSISKCEQVTCSHYKEPYLSNPTLRPIPIVTCGVFHKR